MSPPQLQPYAKTYYTLLVLVLLALVATTVDALAPLWHNNMRLAVMQADGNIWSTVASSLPWRDRLMLTLISALQNVCWLYGLGQIFLLCMDWRQHEVFSTRSFQRLQRFGVALAAMAVVAPWIRPAVAAYLKQRTHISAPLDYARMVNLGDGIDYLFAGTLVFLLASIMKAAVKMADEQRFTV